MSPDADVAVVGAGLMGAATAWALARRGVAVTLFEAREPGHTAGSSHGSARIFRRAYPDPLYVRLTGQSGELWRELEHTAGEPVLRVTGGVDYGRERDPAGLAELLRAGGVQVELLAPEAAAERWTGFAFDGPVLFHPEAGAIDADAAVAAMVRCAVDGGATWHPHTPVRRIEPVADGVVLHLDGSTYRARAVVVAVGGWVGPLLDGVLALPPLTVLQTQAFHFPRRDPTATWPTFVHGTPAGEMYGLPGGRDGGADGAVKVGEHRAGTETTADARSGVVDPAARERVVAYVRRFLPGLDPDVYSETSCLYTFTRSEDFVLDRVGDVVVCSACSSHGAKFAPLVGELAADLAVGRSAGDGSAVPDRFRLAAHGIGTA